MPRSDGLSKATSLAPAVKLGFDGRVDAIHRALPVEAAVGIIYAPTPYAVMMASPVDLEDFVYGFSLTEGVITNAGDIRAVAIVNDPKGFKVSVTLAPDRLRTHLARGRNLAGRTGCGVCGIEDIDQLPFAPPRPRHSQRLSLRAAKRAIHNLDAHLPLGDATRATHAAAWCDKDGDIKTVREDVGRHNALDKLIGALLRSGADPAQGFIVITSRCSFEMVEKAAAFGVAALVSISAPTSLALERAHAHGMTLLAIARADGAMLFTDAAGVAQDLLLEGATTE